MASFRGETRTPSGTQPADDCWRLIGLSGTVVCRETADGLERLPAGARVLVVLDADVSGFGLHCHNRIANTVYLSRAI